MIVNYEGDTAPTIDGVILIDCWNPMESEVEKIKFFNDLTKYLYDVVRPNLRQVINASTWIRLDYQDESILNTLRRYCWDYHFDRNDPDTPNYYNTWILFDTLIQFSGTYTIFTELKEKIFDYRSFFITGIDDFLSHWRSCGPHRATNWLVVGQAWGICLHKNSIGLDRLAEITNSHRMNFFVDSRFAINENNATLTNDDFEQDYLLWTKYHNSTVYRLVGKA